jgi:hypothetical protein
VKNKLTSIQVSVKHRNELKKYCDKNGYNMNKFVEKLLEDNIMKNDGLNTITFKSGTKEEIIQYLKNKTGNKFSFAHTPPNAKNGELFEMNDKLFVDQINNYIDSNPIVNISMWEVIQNDKKEPMPIMSVKYETFFITDFSELRVINFINNIDNDNKKIFEKWLFEEIESNPKFINKIKILAGIK